ncbi:MAG: tetratricopeptide repeat protein [Candidatus Hydrogenedens sp.]
MATTITLAKNKINEYYQLQKQIKNTPPSSSQQLQELNLKARSLINDAQIMLEQIDVLNLDLPEGINTYLDVLEIQGHHDLVVEILQKLVRKNSENGDYWVRLGWNNMKKGNNWLQDAFRCFERAVKLKVSEKEKIRLWKSFGDIYWELRQIEPARESYNKALEIGNDIWSKVGLAGIEVVYGNMKEAEDKLADIGKELQEYDVPVRLRMREALSLFEEQKKNIDEKAETIMAYSHILYRAGRIEDAIATANHALFMNNQNWEGWNFLGSIYLQLGYLKDAEKTFLESLKVNSDQPNLKNIIEELSKRGNTNPPTDKSPQPLIFRKN